MLFRMPGRVMIWQFGDKTQVGSVSLQLEIELDALRERSNSKWSDPVVEVCHATPYTWFQMSTRRIFKSCPTSNAVVRIGRTMFESNSVPESWVGKLRSMDEIWVPTRFHIETFSSAGVPREKLVAIPEAIDTDAFDPSQARPTFPFPASFDNAEFIFLSIFKWERRKGWKYLVQAFSEEFQNDPKIKLFILTHRQTIRDDPWKDIIHLLKTEEDAHNIHVSLQHLGHTELLSLYKSTGALILSSNGEGWGRPVVEAMAMELPVIATNWSGPSEYITEQNSFPLSINQQLIPIDHFSMGGEEVQTHFWAEPSITHLKYLMRYIVDHPEEATKRGRQARRDMLSQYTTKLVSKLVEKQLQKAVDSFVVKLNNSRTN